MLVTVTVSSHNMFEDMYGVSPTINHKPLRAKRNSRYTYWICLCLVLLAAPIFCMLSIAAQSSSDQAIDESGTSQQLQRAVAEYERLLAHPVPGTAFTTLETIRLRLGTAYFLLKRYSDSLRVLSPLIAARATGPEPRPLLAQAWLICGLDHLDLNQAAEAIAPLHRALANDPKNANARLALGDSFARTGQMEDAEQQYEDQLHLTPSLANAWYKLGMVHIQLALDWKTHLAADPDASPLSQELVARDLLASQANWDAARLLLDLAKSFPSQPGVHSDLGRALFALGYTKSAADEFRRELASDPENPFAMLGIAEVDAFDQQWAAADAEIDSLARYQSRTFTRMVESAPLGPLRQAWNDGSIRLPGKIAATPEGSFWKTWLTMSSLTPNMLSSLPHPDQICATIPLESRTTPGHWLSQPCYRKLLMRLQAHPHSSASQPKWMETLFRLGDYTDTMRLARTLLRSNPKDPWAAYWLSRSHSELAGDCFVKLALLDPASPRVHQMLAERYLGWGQFTQAIAEYQTAIRLAPSLPDLHLGLGDAYARMLDWSHAVTEFQKALDLAPGSVAARVELGHAYVKIGDWKSAVDVLRTIPSDAPQTAYARLDLANAENQLGDTRQAVTDLLPVVSRDKDGEIHFRLAVFYRKLGDLDRAKQAMQAFQSLRAAQLAVSHSEIQALEAEKAADLPAPPASN